MAEPPVVSFAVVLLHLRTSAGMTQEQLADRAGLSPRSISDLERGVHRTARQETIKLLVQAFGLTGSDQMAFEAAARGRPLAGEIAGPGPQAGGVAAATRTLPRDVSSFTGREPELDELIGTVTDHIRSGWVADIYAIVVPASPAYCWLMPPTSSPRGFPMGRSSCPCMVIPRGSSRSTRPTR